MLTPKIMQTTKTYMKDPIERIILDSVAEESAKPWNRMIALIDLANDKNMKRLKE